ncbi:hypothetical protein DFH11DRAFT_1609623 [Phellopilus nigrolimitatus]|nr:hypothetical protein DFH11DRAFT_1609623 [Phellopilus nigrolimitatus]
MDNCPHIVQCVSVGSGGNSHASLLSPVSRGTVDSERRSILSPSPHPSVPPARNLSTEGAYVSRAASSHSRMSKSGLSDGAESIDEESALKHNVHQASNVAYEFKEFIQSCIELESHLDNFTHQIQKLGSALRLVLASREIHRDLADVRDVFEKNAESLDILLKKVKVPKSAKQAKRKKRRGTVATGPHTGSTLTGSYNELVNGALIKLAKSVQEFTVAIEDFEDYTDEDGNNALHEFEIELRVLSASLEYFGFDENTDELRRYVTAKASSMKGYLERVANALKRFEEIGIPCISFSQKRSTRMLLNAATVATFFAGVAATTLQYSVQLNSSKREVAMNTLWFSSLVLSIGAAITGMLAMTWRAAVFSSPKQSLPWFIRFWIRSGYLALLIASVIAFLAGLLVYVFDSQHIVAFWIVTGFTAFFVIGLANVTVLFVRERWTFSVVRNQMRENFHQELGRLKVYDSSETSVWGWLKYYFVDQLRKQRLRFREGSSSVAGLSELSEHGRFSSFKELLIVLGSSFALFRPGIDKKKQRRSRADSDAGVSSNAGDNKRPHAWRHGSKHNDSSIRPNRAQSDPLQRPQLVQGDSDPGIYKKQVTKLGLKLSAEQRALHLQFSPTGRWLVVCFKYECCVFDVENSFEFHQTLSHRRKKAKQVEWSPNGQRLLTRINDDVKVWRIDEQDNFVFDKFAGLLDVSVSDIQWLNDGEFLAIADESTIFRVDVTGDEVMQLEFCLERDNDLLELYYMYTMPQSDLVFIVAARKIDYLPEDRAIDCVIVYQMHMEAVETQSQSSRSTRNTTRYGSGTIKRRIPLLHDVENLSFSLSFPTDPDRSHMLVSYSDKPPEIWIIGVTSESDQTQTTVDVSLVFELSKNVDVESQKKTDPETEWGDAFFIGPAKSIIACAEDGVMHFWDLHTHEHFHCLQILGKDEEIEELPVVTWITHSSAPLPMMATAGKGLSLKIFAPIKDKAEDMQMDKGENEKGIDLTHEGGRTPILANHELSISADPAGTGNSHSRSPTAFAYPVSRERGPSQHTQRRPSSPPLVEGIPYTYSPANSIHEIVDEKGSEEKDWR